MSKIKDIKAIEVLDSRADPTVRCCVFLDDGCIGTATVPSGASRGKYEATELRDGDSERYGGKGRLTAIKNVSGCIRDSLIGMEASEQEEIDLKMSNLDGTSNKKELGANAILSVSMAVCAAAARSMHIPLYSHIRRLFGEQKDEIVMPTPMMNVINGGVHADNNLDIQEFMIVPTANVSFSERLRLGVTVYRSLRRIITERGLAYTIGDEGGFAPDLEADEDALSMLSCAISSAGLDEASIRISIDAAAGEWYKNGKYESKKQAEAKGTDRMIEYFCALSQRYDLFSIEDALCEDDYHGYEILTKRLSDKVMLVGDDLFVTNCERLKYGAGRGLCNAILIKPNQIGTVSETLKVIRLAKEFGYEHIISHRSGETEDTFIADLAVGTGAKYIKSGAPRGAERLAKYNRLLEIESGLHM